MGVDTAFREPDLLVLAAIDEAAHRAAPCPTNADLEHLIGSANSTGSTAVGILGRLEARGLIRVERYQRSRRVTIVATGMSTAEPKNKALHWRQRPASMPAPSLSVVRARSPDVAARLMVAARHEGRGFADFLADLVWEAAVARGLLDSLDAQGRAG